MQMNCAGTLFFVLPSPSINCMIDSEVTLFVIDDKQQMGGALYDHYTSRAIQSPRTRSTYSPALHNCTDHHPSAAEKNIRVSFVHFD